MNMHYCRNQNTLGDLRECVESLKEGERVSETESGARLLLRDLCIEYINAFAEFEQERGNKELTIDDMLNKAREKGYDRGYANGFKDGRKC